MQLCSCLGPVKVSNSIPLERRLTGLSHSPKAPHHGDSRMPVEDLSLLQGQTRGGMYAIRELCSSAEHGDQQFIEGSESDD